MSGFDGSSSDQLRRDAEGLLRWSTTYEIDKKEKLERIQNLKDLIKEQEIELRSLEVDIDKVEDEIDGFDKHDIKVNSLCRQLSAQKSTTEFLKRKVTTLTENQHQDPERFRQLEVDMRDLTTNNKETNISFQRKDNKVRSLIKDARQKKEEMTNYHVNIINCIKEKATNLDNQVNELKNEAQSREIQLESANNDLENIEQNILQKKNDIEALKQTASLEKKEHDEEVERIKQKMVETKAENEVVQENLDQLVDQFRKLEVDCDEKNKQTDQNNMEIKNLEVSLERIKSKLLTTQGEFEAAEQDVLEEEAVIKQLSIKQEQIERLNSDYSNLTEKLLLSEERNASLRDQIIDMNNMKRENYKLTKYVSDLEKQICDEQETFSMKIKYLEASIQKAKREKDQRVGFNQDEMESLTDELNMITSRHQQILKEIESYTAALNNLNQESVNMEEEICQLTTQLEKDEVEISDTDKKIADLLALEEENRISRETAEKECYNLLEKVSNQERDGEEEVRKLEDERNDLQKELQDLASTLKAITQSLGTGSQGSQGNSKVTKVKNTLIELQEKIESTQENIKEVEGKISELNASNEGCEEEKQDLIRKIEAVRLDVTRQEALEAEFAQLETEIQSTLQSLPQNSDKHEKLDESMERVKTKKDKLEETLNEEKNYMANFEVNLSTMEAFHQKNLDSLNNELKEAREELDDKEKQLERKREEIEVIENEMEDLKKEQDEQATELSQ